MPACDLAAGSPTIGQCVECTSNPTNVAACKAPKVVCNAQNKCAVCNSDKDCLQSPAPITTPICNTAADTCQKCTTNGQCVVRMTSVPGALPVCDTISGACVGCVRDTDCADPTKPICASDQPVATADPTPNARPAERFPVPQQAREFAFTTTAMPTTVTCPTTVAARPMPRPCTWRTQRRACRAATAQQPPLSATCSWL